MNAAPIFAVADLPLDRREALTSLLCRPAANVEPSYAISTFANAHDTHPKAREVTFAKLAAELGEQASAARPACADERDDALRSEAKKRLPAWSPAAFDGGRLDANVTELRMLVADLDHVPLGELDRALAGLEARGLAHVAYESHGAALNEPGRTSCRLVLPLDRPIPRARWRAFRAVALRYLGLEALADPTCANESRIYFVPCARADGSPPAVGAVDGAPLWVAVVEAWAEDHPAPVAPTAAAARGDRVRASAYLATIEPAIQGSGGSKPTFRAAQVLVHKFGLDDATALDLLEREYNPRCVPPWSRRELEHKIASARADGRMARASDSGSAASFDILEAGAIFAPLAPIDYLVPALDMAAGAPTLIAGYGYSGKTVAAQQLAMDLARPHEGLRLIWGKFPARRERSKVLHVDYEQGQLTLRRYQRLALAAEVDPRELEGYLRVISLPSLFLPGAADALERACDGCDLVIVDSLRAAVPGIEENSSDFRRPLDALTRVSDHTGCAMLVISHARKPSQDNSGGAKMAIRGTGAIFDACSSVLVFAGEKYKPTRVSHEKARNSGNPADDFDLLIEDVGEAKEGLRVSVSAPRKADELQRTKDGILAYIATHGSAKSHKELAANLRVRPQTIGGALDSLTTEGRVFRDGPQKDQRYYIDQRHTANGSAVPSGSGNQSNV